MDNKGLMSILGIFLILGIGGFLTVPGCITFSNNTLIGGGGSVEKNTSDSGLIINASNEKIIKLKNTFELLFKLQTNQNITLKYVNYSDNEQHLTINFALPDGTPFSIITSRNVEYIYGNTQTVMSVDAFHAQAQNLQAQMEEMSKNTSTKIIKSDKPVVELFVMSYCPYGLQMQKAVIPVYELLGNKINFSTKFVYYLMHGEKEAWENTRQYCIEKEQPEKYIAYLKCFLNSSNSTKCIEDAEINKSTVGECINKADQEFGINNSLTNKSTWLNGRYPLYNVHSVSNKAYDVGGSPTLIINGVVVNTGRAPEQVKDAICNAFNVVPAECNTTLSTEAQSPGFGYDTGLGASHGGGCEA